MKTKNHLFIFYIFLVLVSLYLFGCHSKKTEDLFVRINIPPAAKGAPKFNPSELIHQDNVKRVAKFKISKDELNNLPPDKLISKAWSALGKGAYDVAIEIANKALERFSKEAEKQQMELAGQFPKAGEEKKYKELNAAGTALYIIAEAYEKKGLCKKALVFYQKAIEQFPLSQNWDPRGWYWKVKEESESKIEKLKKGGCE